MGRLAVRVFMALVGVSLLALYGISAVIVYEFLVAVWAARPPLPVAVGIVLVIAVVFGFLSYRFGTNRMLANLNAVELPRRRAPAVHDMVDRLVEQMDIGRPDVLVAEMAAPNALALGGTGNGALVLDSGLFQLLEADELETIIAHELAHLEGHDSLIQTLAFSTVRTVVGLLVLVLFPVLLLLGGVARGIAWIRGHPFNPRNAVARFRYVVGQLVVLVFVGLTLVVRAHSRRREYAADDRAVEITGKPLALARALAKIKQAAEAPWGLLSPLYTHGDETGTLTRMLSTHPPIEERIERLRQQAEQHGHRIEIE